MVRHFRVHGNDRFSRRMNAEGAHILFILQVDVRSVGGHVRQNNICFISERALFQHSTARALECERRYRVSVLPPRMPTYCRTPDQSPVRARYGRPRSLGGCVVPHPHGHAASPEGHLQTAHVSASMWPNRSCACRHEAHSASNFHLPSASVCGGLMAMTSFAQH